jgi:hypothetical protein
LHYDYDSSLRIWFDRDISFGIGEGLSADVVSLPSLVTPRSNERLKEDSRIMSKQDVKLHVVQQAIYNVGRDAAPAAKDVSSALDKFLNTVD